MSSFPYGEIPPAGAGSQQQPHDNNLPQELITEILSWSPLKSLLRFRCVSKTWHRLLTADTAFSHLHHHRSKNHNVVFWTDYFHPKTVAAIYNVQDYARAPGLELDPPVKLDLPFDKMNPPYGICNGLLYLTADNYAPPLFICNPLTGDHVSIHCPRIPLCYPLGGRNFNFGFGPSQGSNADYKVVRLLSSKYVSEFQSHVVVHTLGTDSWRTLESIPYKILSNPQLVCGALHWLGAKSGSTFQNEIVSFDIKTEIFRGIQPPNDVQFKHPHIVTIGELNGLLHIYSGERGESLHIWAMKNYGAVDSWAKLYKLDQPMTSSFNSLLQPQGVTDNGDIILLDTGSFCANIVLYNPTTNSTSSLKCFSWCSFLGYSYVGSLISPRLVSGESKPRK